MNKESRRNFVKKTAVLSTATLATTLPVDAFANVTENKKLVFISNLLTATKCYHNRIEN